MRRLLFAAAIGVVLLPLPITTDVIATNILILDEGDIQAEDAYVLADSGRVDGTIDGDLVIATGGLSIGGRITGDVLVATYGSVTITGVVEGSLRGLARDLTVSGAVMDDIAVTVGSATISGDVGRDLLVFAGSLDFSGTVGRDIKGRFINATVDGSVGRDVDVTVSSVRLGAAADIRGDFLYRADSDASIAPGAEVAGQTARLSARGSFFVRTFLTAANILSYLAFLFTGIIVFWLFRGSAPGAVREIVARPWRTLIVGIGAAFLLPTLGLLIAATLIGLPIGALMILGFVLGLFFAPIPAVTAFGDRIVRSRFGLFGAFLLGASLWRLGIWLVPIVGILLYFAALAWGLGGWLIAGWEQRRRSIAETSLFPGGPRAARPDEASPQWEPPLPPEAAPRRGTDERPNDGTGD